MNNSSDHQHIENFVWLSRTLLNLDEAFGFSCQHFETAKDDFLDILHRFKVGKDVADDELPQVIWCNNAKDDRKKRLPHLFKAGGFFIATQEAKDVLTGFDLGASRFVPVQLFHRDRKTPWPGAHFFLCMPDRIPAFSPEHSRRYKPKRYEDRSYTGTIPFDVADGIFPSTPARLPVRTCGRIPACSGRFSSRTEPCKRSGRRV